MPNTVRLHRVLATKPDKVYRAFIEADAMAKWLPPNGFTCTVHHLDAKVGGTYRMSDRRLHGLCELACGPATKGADPSQCCGVFCHAGLDLSYVCRGAIGYRSACAFAGGCRMVQVELAIDFRIVLNMISFICLVLAALAPSVAPRDNSAAPVVGRQALAAQ